jgi:hypothetical protein
VAGLERLDLGAMAVFLYAFREREDLMDCYEAVSGARMHATYYRPGGVYRDLPTADAEVQGIAVAQGQGAQALNEWREGSMLDFLERLLRRLPARIDEYETLLTDNRIWKQRTVGIGVVSPGEGAGLGHDRPDAARLRHRLGPAQEAALRQVRGGRFRHPGRRQRRLLRPLPGAHRGDAPVHPHHQAVREVAARQPGPGDAVDNYKVSPPSRER